MMDVHERRLRELAATLGLEVDGPNRHGVFVVGEIDPPRRMIGAAWALLAWLEDLTIEADRGCEQA